MDAFELYTECRMVHEVCPEAKVNIKVGME